jgi:adenylate kinase
MKRLGFDLIILGDPTSGKDTQVDLLKKKYFLKPVETGKQWRIMVKKNDFNGRWLKRTFGLGHPAPVAIVKWFLNKKVKDIGKSEDLIFVGNPRLKPEAQFLIKLLKQKNRDYFVLYLKLPEKEIYARAAKRKIQEDTKEKTKRRIDWTKRQVGKTVKYFQSLGKLKFINGNQTIKQVSNEIGRAINDYKKRART